jgi:hypothetical protein
MAKFFLINNLRLGIAFFEASQTLDDAVDPVAAIRAAGGILWPVADAGVAAAAANGQTLKLQGAPPEDVQGIMVAALEASISNMVQGQRSVTITQAANLAGLGAGVKTLDVNVGLVLPTGARLTSPPTLETVTLFDDAAHGTYAVIVGTTVGGNEIATTQSVAAGQTGFPKIMTAGAAGFPQALQSAVQVKARLTSSVDLNTATVGAVTIVLGFVVPSAFL